VRFGCAIVMLATIFLTVPCQADDDLMQRVRNLFQPIPQSPPELPGNPATPAKLQLGKMLYFEPRLSASHTISCNTCHNIGMAGIDALETSIGHRWQHGARHAPTVLNAVFNKAQFWDGRAKDLQEQAGGPIVNPLEMASSAPHVAEMLKAIPGYVEAFKEAFPDTADPVSMTNAQKAIAAFEATLITPNAPFDKFLKGDATALSSEQKEGLRLFMDRGCSNCHNGINVGGGMYAPFGVAEQPDAELLPPTDPGRFAVTHSVNDQYVFKVPMLRNVALTAPYFHTGRCWDLRQAVAVMGSVQLGMRLTDAEVTKITAFLDSLTGEPPRIVYPILPPNVAGTPQPQP
jgi:cytochrome c peroxidase